MAPPDPPPSRRAILRSLGALGTAALAGCPAAPPTATSQKQDGTEPVADGSHSPTTDSAADRSATTARTTDASATSASERTPDFGTDDLPFHGGRLEGFAPVKPTALDLGPEGHLFVAEQGGLVYRLAVRRRGPGDFVLDRAQRTRTVRDLPNHHDDGAVATALEGRQVTGLAVGGMPDRPVAYVTSSDPRLRVGRDPRPSASVDTNSGILSRLTWSDGTPRHELLVRGLPRSQAGHATNGLAVDATNRTVYLAQGGHTNMGAPSAQFSGLPEYALSGAILAVDLGSLPAPSVPDGATEDATPVAYDLPTLAGTAAPFGGRDGENMARMVPDGPVDVHAPGFRNPYDVTLARDGTLFSVDNGPNAGWGGPPLRTDEADGCSHVPHDGGSRRFDDGLHRIESEDYGGHPNPTRANPGGTGFDGAVPAADPRQCEYRRPGVADGALVTFPASTNGLVEYRADAFDGRLTGDLLAASYTGAVHRIHRGSGDAGTQTPLLESPGCLGIATAGTEARFPGTVWTANRERNEVRVFEPAA